MEFNRISNVHLSEEEMEGRVLDPPASLMQKLGLELRDRLGISAFNVDILREEGKKDRWLRIIFFMFSSFNSLFQCLHLNE